MPEPVSRSLVTLDVAGGVATITINRPDSLNSLNPATVHQLSLAVERAIGDSTVRGIVLAGAGRAFVVGADVEFFVRNMEAGDIARIVKFTASGHRLMNLIDQSPKPVVARVHGMALGGAELALACHQIVATPAAKFSFPETGLGIYPGLGGTQRTPRMIGAGLAKWLIFTGHVVGAADAEHIGLVHHVVNDAELDETCRLVALGERTASPRSAQGPKFAALDAFFNFHRAEALYSGTAETAGDPVLIRALHVLRTKSAFALQLAEWLIDEGGQRSLAEGLNLELDRLPDVFGTQDALQRLRASS